MSGMHVSQPEAREIIGSSLWNKLFINKYS